MADSRISVSCANCGSDMLVWPSEFHRRKYCSKPCRAVGIRTHGETINNIDSVEYNCWRSMLKRCLTPTDNHYAMYGARGITVCDRWRNSFDAFLADVGRRPSSDHSIDRWPDNMGNYEPGNTRWATAVEQNTNKPNNHLLTFNGTTRCVSDWARETGINYEVLLQRLIAGWSTERALTTPEGAYSRLEDRPNAKLTVSAVQHIRSCDLSERALAKIYGVSESAVGNARRRITWKSC